LVASGEPLETVARFQAYRSGQSDPVRLDRVQSTSTVDETAPAWLSSLPERPPKRWRSPGVSRALAARAAAIADRRRSVVVKDGSVGRAPRRSALSFLNAPPRATTVVAPAEGRGAVLLGKANMGRIGINPIGLNPHHGAAETRTTGRASLAARQRFGSRGRGGLAPLSISADGGGSIQFRRASTAWSV
jgi:hypothetical protein